jgi:hypothetical protein
MEAARVPLCKNYMRDGIFSRTGPSDSCIKPAGISRGAGFQPANQRQCELASNGRGCELSLDRTVYFPRCAAGYSARGSLCSLNCPMGWADLGSTCNMPRSGGGRRFVR